MCKNNNERIREISESKLGAVLNCELRGSWSSLRSLMDRVLKPAKALDYKESDSLSDASSFTC